MRHLFTLNFLLVTLTFCYGQKPETTNTPDSTITILRYGFPTPDLFEYGNLARKYNFELVTVANCMVTSSLRDSVARHNKIAYGKLDKLNGENWRDNYENEVKQAYSRDTTMINKLKTEKFICDKYSEEQKHHNGLIYVVDSSLGADIYRINVLGYLDTTSITVSFYRVYMDFRTLKIKSKEESIQLLDRYFKNED